MKNSEVPVMALRRAVQICNGIDSLADALNVDGQKLAGWIAGAEEVPMPVFIQTVGLLLEATATRSPRRQTPDSNEGGRKGPRH